jgi:predicted O-methyltransferase YrrM
MTVRGFVTPEEHGRITRIERHRRELEESTDQITYTDFGAGDPNAGLSEAEMRAGREVNAMIGRICTHSSTSPFWCLFLFRLIRTLQPTSLVEIGTGVGISAAYQGAAVQLNGVGSLVTLEGAASLAQVARAGLENVGVDDVAVIVGNAQDTLPDVLAERQPIDYAFVDAHHDERATLRYFERILGSLGDPAVVVFDDIRWSAGMERAWRAVTNRDAVAVAVDLGEMGVCVIDSSMSARRTLTVPIQRWSSAQSGAVAHQESDDRR